MLKEKTSGIYRARLCALGYSQIPGIDYTDNYAPVLKDTTFRAIIVIKTNINLHVKMVDVETSFLHAPLKETIYMKPPSGTSYEKMNAS